MTFAVEYIIESTINWSYNFVQLSYIIPPESRIVLQKHLKVLYLRIYLIGLQGKELNSLGYMENRNLGRMLFSSLKGLHYSMGERWSWRYGKKCNQTHPKTLFASDFVENLWVRNKNQSNSWVLTHKCKAGTSKISIYMLPNKLNSPITTIQCTPTKF